MILQFNWDRLDVTAAEAIRALVNAKLEERLRQQAPLAANGSEPLAGSSSDGGNGNSSNNCGNGGGGGGSTRVESLRVVSIEWGIAPPFIEIVRLDDAQDFSNASRTTHDLAALYTPFRHSPSGSSQPAGDPASEADSSMGGHSSAPKFMSAAAGGTWPGGGSPQMNAPPAPARDALAPFFGPGGLYISLHVTYGGPMRLALSSVVRHDIQLGPLSLPVRMPMTVVVSNMDMDFFLSVNFHQNKCRIWMKPGKLSTSPITRMNIKTVFGERRNCASHSAESTVGMSPLGEDLDASNAWTHLGSSHMESEEEDSVVFTEENVISQFVLSEIRAILQEKIIYPHFVELPLFL